MSFLEHVSLIVNQIHLTHREIGKPCGNRLQLVKTVETGQIGKVNISHEGTQPWSVRSGYASALVNEGVLGGVPVLGVHIGARGGTHISHSGSRGIRRNGQ